MLRKIRCVHIPGLDALERRAAGSPEQLVIIFDVDNTLVPHGAPPAELIVEVERAVERFEAIPAVDRVIVLSNGAQRSHHMISGANKPWTSRRRLGLDAWGGAVWVVGDQVLTDGLLAWRLGAEFCYLAISETADPALQAGMRLAGRLAGLLLLEQADDG